MTSDSTIDFVSILNTFNQNILDDIVKSEEFSEYIKDYLTDHTIVVEFVKKNGELRKMRCTRNSNLIPQESAPKQSKDSGVSIRVFDLDKMEWRSFIPSSIQKIEWGFNYKDLH